MTRSEVARRAGVNSETVRYYEQRALIPEPPRSPSGYRIYDAQYVERLLFIKRAQELGFSLDEIRDLLALKLDASEDKASVRAQAERKLAAVEEKIRDLERIRSVLHHLVDACEGHGSTSDCPILEALSDATLFDTLLHDPESTHEPNPTPCHEHEAH